MGKERYPAMASIAPYLIFAAIIIVLTLPNIFPLFFSYQVEGTSTNDIIGQIDEDVTRDILEVPYIKDLKYVAIGPENYSDTIAPLIEWKTQKGVKAHYFELEGSEGVLENSQGRDIQEKVRFYIKALKDTNPYVEWVLLVGDGEIIPSRRTFVNGTAENGADDNDNYVLTDYYYAGLEGSWDTNGNQIFGEEGEQAWYANVNLGRFPASDKNELKIMVDRQVRYEKDPAPGSWSRSMLLAGSLMDAPNNQGMFDPYKDNAYELVIEVENQLPSYVEPFHLLDYPRLEWGGYNRMFDDLNHTSFEDHYEMGFSTVLIACHGDVNGNCTNYKGEGGGNYPYWADYETHFDYSTAETIANGRRTPLLYISNCDSLNFTEEDDTNMERVLRNPNGGAIGIIGASVTTYRGEFGDENSYGNWWLAKEFYRILYGESPRPGEALYKQKENYINYIFSHPSLQFETELFRMFYIDNLAYNLLGDPEGPIWLDTPRELSVDHPYQYDQDNTSIRFKVEDPLTGSPVQGAVITLMDPTDEDVYFISTTNEDGEVVIYHRPDGLSPLQLTVTMEGYRPHIKEIEVVSLKNLKMVGGLVLVPEIPVKGKPFVVSAQVLNGGEVPLDNVLLSIELKSPAQISPYSQERLITYIEPDETITVNLSFPAETAGLNTISGRVILLSDSVESETDDNMISIGVLVNDPLFFGSLPNLATLEDTRLSASIGLFNISTFVIDPDNYPSPISFSMETILGDLTVEEVKPGLIDIIPGHDFNGNGTIRVHASDGSVTATKDLAIIVQSVPDPPVFREFPEMITGFEGETEQFQVVLSDVDSTEIMFDLPGVEDFTYERSMNGSGLVYNISFTPGNEHVGSSSLLIVAFDGMDESTDRLIPMIITTRNDPPEVVYPDIIEVEEGREIKVPLDIFDPDGSKNIKVGAQGVIVSSYYFADGVLYLNYTDGIEKGSYNIDIWVDDNDTGGNVTFRMIVKINEKDREPIFLTFIFLVGLIILILASYGIFLRTRESKQKEILDKVGDEAMLTIPRGGRRQRSSSPKHKQVSIPVPPAPTELEGDLARKELVDLKGHEKVEDVSPAYKDLESDLDDVIDELYPAKAKR